MAWAQAAATQAGSHATASDKPKMDHPFVLDSDRPNMDHVFLPLSTKFKLEKHRIAIGSY